MTEDDPSRSRGLLLLAAAAVFGAAAGCDRPAAATPPGDPDPPMPAFVPATPALRAGDELPALAAEGWLNGAPPAPSAPGVRLMVVDVWAQWCPLCRQGAPGLLELSKKYAGRGVAFVSLTNMPRNPVVLFGNEFALTWPIGYGATAETIVALGAGSGMPTPGYGIAPTLYVVDTGGRIVWSDEHARFRHVESAQWWRDVERAIDAALAARTAHAR